MYNILVILNEDSLLYPSEVYDELKVDYVKINAKIDIQNYSLCIVEADFSDKKFLDKVKKLVRSNTNIEFWAGSKMCNKEDVTLSYSLGCKNFVKFPLSGKVLTKYFYVKNNANKKIAEQVAKIEIKENFENMRVLIVDDNEINIELLKEVLSVFKTKTICFNNSVQALQYSQMESIDLILLDIMMPGVNGFEFAQRLKHIDKNKETPIIFISALNGNENKLKGFSLGSYAYIEKPFEINTVRAQIFNILKIQRLQKQKENFIATLTHDLRTPIRAQVCALKLLLDNKFGKLTNEQDAIIKEILKSSNFLQFMTDDLLIKYKFDSGTLGIKKENHSLDEVISGTLQSLKFLIEQNKQTVVYRYESGVREIEFDFIELSRVLNNLIVNASEYSGENTQIIVQVKDTSTKDFLEISVTDTGHGLSPNEIEIIFEEYQSGAKKFNKVGAGLGLFISKKIVQLHGGNIWAESHGRDQGATFVFTLPTKIKQAVLAK